MTYSEEIKKIRQKCFLSQEAFGRELGVSFSSINRWESRKTKPNMSAMKKIKELNKKMPTYKYIRNLIITDEPLIKTTTNKVKRQEELKKILGK